jgi:hypothetical protein
MPVGLQHHMLWQKMKSYAGLVEHIRKGHGLFCKSLQTWPVESMSGRVLLAVWCM